jgi:quercetin dioxygenase-like cupin family protein
LTSSNTPIAQVIKLRDLVAYQSGAVVSRTLVNEDEGSITAFAFDEGQGLSEHAAPYDASVVVIEGEVEIKISGSPHRLKEGEMIIMPANKPHALRAVTKMKMLLVMVRSKQATVSP